MEVSATSLPGVYRVDPRVFVDQRGFFMETWQAEGMDGLLPDTYRVKLAVAPSRGSDTTLENAGRFRAEIAYMLAKWGPRLQHDSYYNPHLTLCREDFSLKTPADVAEMQAFLQAFPALGQVASQRPSLPATLRPLHILTESARVVTAHEP
jgi:hypothetical protein